MKTNKITALYCRISREDEMTDVSSSIETQKTFLKRYANQNKYDNIEFFIDDGHSGANFERPGFMSLKEDIENNQIAIVITKDLSGLGRNYLTTGYYIISNDTLKQKIDNRRYNQIKGISSRNPRLIEYLIETIKYLGDRAENWVLDQFGR